MRNLKNHPHKATLWFHGLALTSLLVISGCSGHSNIEQRLAKEFRRASDGTVTLAIRKVECQAPKKGKTLPCVVEFHEKYKLPDVSVQVPGNLALFPAEFEFSHSWIPNSLTEDDYQSLVVTSYDGSTLSAEAAGTAIATTAQAAVKLAIAASGDAYERQRIKVTNMESYTENR